MHQHIQALRDLIWRVLKGRIFYHLSLSSFLVELDVCLHARQLSHGRIYSYDALSVYLPFLPPDPCAIFISISKLLNSWITD